MRGFLLGENFVPLVLISVVGIFLVDQLCERNPGQKEIPNQEGIAVAIAGTGAHCKQSNADQGGHGQNGKQRQPVISFRGKLIEHGHA